MMYNMIRQKGFTLVEVMIVVVVVAILASIALPAYQEQVKKGRRADVQAVLLEGAQFMERYYTENNNFTGASLPTALASSPKDGSTKYYSIALTSDATSFTLTATPSGAMAGDGNMTIDQAGEKLWAGSKYWNGDKK